MKVLSTFFLAALIGNANIKTYDLTITIPNIKNTNGGVHVSVYSSKNKASFTKIGQQFKVWTSRQRG